MCLSEDVSDWIEQCVVSTTIGEIHISQLKVKRDEKE